MGTSTPDTADQVINRIKVDIQREAPDSNPYLKENWLQALAVAIGTRQFDEYGDLKALERRILPDTADTENAQRWGQIYIGPQNVASTANGNVTITGVVGGFIPIGHPMSSDAISYLTTSSATIGANVINITSITLSGTTATVTTANNHNLSSFVPVTIAGADQIEYNLTDTDIVVTGLKTFTYQVTGSPATPATGTITAAFTSANVSIESVETGQAANLDADTPLSLDSPLADVDSTANVDFGAIGGGTDAETITDYVTRYLAKIRFPVAHFNAADIEEIAKTIAGVTRVFVEEAGTEIGTISVASITRNGNVATVTTDDPHGFDDGQRTSIAGAFEAEYNVDRAQIIIESALIFHYVVIGSPDTPATGGISATTSIPLGQVRTFFTRDNDDNIIPDASEVQAVEDRINTIRPATTQAEDNIVKAPTGVPSNYVFTNITPNTPTMSAAIEANLNQFHEEQTIVSVNVDEDKYRAAIANTVDPDTGDVLLSFVLSAPSGDIVINSGELSTMGTFSTP